MAFVSDDRLHSGFGCVLSTLEADLIPVVELHIEPLCFFFFGKTPKNC
jgi:hypothetical protein